MWVVSEYVFIGLLWSVLYLNGTTKTSPFPNQVVWIVAQRVSLQKTVLSKNATIGNNTANDDVALHVSGRRVIKRTAKNGLRGTHLGRSLLQCNQFCFKRCILLEILFNRFQWCNVCNHDCHRRVWIDLFYDRCHFDVSSNPKHFYELVNHLQTQ